MSKLALFPIFLWLLFAVPGRAVPVEWITDTPDEFAVRFNFEKIGPELWDVTRPPMTEQSPSALWMYVLLPSGRNPGTPLYETYFNIWTPGATSLSFLSIGLNVSFGTTGSRALGGSGELADSFHGLFSWNISADGSGHMLAEGTRNVPEGGSLVGAFVIGLAGIAAARRRSSKGP